MLNFISIFLLNPTVVSLLPWARSEYNHELEVSPNSSDAGVLPTGDTGLPHAAVTWRPLDKPRQATTARTCDNTAGTLTLPLLGQETSRFGLRADPLGGGVRLHAGIDLAAPLDSPVKSSGSGEVLRAGWARGYGNLVVIDHGHGLTTRYAHLERSLVNPGQFVAHGQEIGLVGATGHATGSHLHFEIRIGGRALDPDHAAVSCPGFYGGADHASGAKWFGPADLPVPAMARILGEVPARSGWNGPDQIDELPTPIFR